MRRVIGRVKVITMIMIMAMMLLTTCIGTDFNGKISLNLLLIIAVGLCVVRSRVD